MKTFMMTLVAVLLLSFMPINTQASLGMGKAKVTYVSQKKSKKKSKKKKSKSHRCKFCGSAGVGADGTRPQYISDLRGYYHECCAHDVYGALNDRNY